MLRKIIKSCLTTTLLCSIAVPAYAASDWSFYGSSRVSTFQENLSKEQNSATTGKASSNFALDLQSNSRIGANVKNGEFAGRFEYGSAPSLRLIYGTWEPSAGTLLIGQSYTPANIGISNQVYGGDNNITSAGVLDTGRDPMIQFSTKMGLTVAAVKPNRNDSANLGKTTSSLPAIEASYNFESGGFSAGIVIGTESLKSESATTSVTQTATVAGGHAQMKFGAARIALAFLSATNANNYGMSIEGGSADATYDATTGNLTDATSTGFGLVGGSALSETMSIEAGYASLTNNSGVTGAKDDGTTIFYLQLPIKLASAVSVIPELSTYDYAKDSTDAKEGSKTYAGAKWMINF